VSTKNFSPFGSAVWPSIRNIYMNVLFYYIDNNNNTCNSNSNSNINKYNEKKNDNT